jgi:hypothetical protein
MTASTCNVVYALRQDFLEEVRVSSAMSDALKVRGTERVYKKVSKNAEPKHLLRREEFREELRSNLQQLAEDYKDVVISDDHIRNIRKLAADLSSSYKDILDGDLSFGVAAKALNTYLKNRWCADGNIKPTHCPFDRRVLKKIRPRKKKGQASTFHDKWTDATEGHYKEWVSLATGAAGGLSLSEWELKLWQEEVVKERQKVQERLKRRTRV